VSKKYHVFVDPQADRKLAMHIEFLARVSEAATVRLYDEYEKSLDFLKNTPASCPPYIPQNPIDAKLKYKLFVRRHKTKILLLKRY
jgi:hypothetical protein